jgi:glycosyltransferase involved in cell wall biosynthesis
LFVDTLYKIGGIETWTYNFCKAMHKYYDILVLAKNIDPDQQSRLLPYAEITSDFNRPIVCDTAINCRYVLELPKNVEYKKYFQVVHTCKMKPEWTIKDQADKVFYVSKVAADTFGDTNGQVIHNLTNPQEPKKALLLVSATRLSYEKGGQRMLDFGWMLENMGIPYVWFVFTDGFLQVPPPGMIFKKPTLDIAPYVKAADFLVALSDQESYGYSIVEAWEMGTPTITTPLSVLPELGFVEGKQGFTVPFDVQKAESLENKLFTEYKPFKWRNSNREIVKQWREVLGDTKPTRKYKPQRGLRWVRALLDFKDIQQNRDVKAGEVYQVPFKRAEEGQKAGFWTILN